MCPGVKLFEFAKHKEACCVKNLAFEMTISYQNGSLISVIDNKLKSTTSTFDSFKD